MLLEDIMNIDIHNMVYFTGASIIGMLFAYYRKWSWEFNDTTLYEYMLGDKHAIGRAITTLIVLLTATSSLNYLDTMEFQQILIAGAGIGLMVPGNIEAEKLKEGNING